MRPAALFLAVCFLGSDAVLLAQGGTVVVPVGWDQRTGQFGGNLLTWPQRDHPIHVQYGWDVRDFGFVTGLLTSVEFRRHGAAWYSTPDITMGTTVALSMGPNAPRSFSRTFAQNEGPTRVVVFSGLVHWPATQPGRGVPPFVAKIPFSTPFLFQRDQGKSLVMDSRVVSSTHPNDWQYDQAKIDWGRVVDSNFIQPLQCRDSLGNQVGLKVIRIAMYPGGSIRITYVGGTPNALGTASIGFRGKGSTWGPWLLPIPLDGLGAPNCWWAVASEYFWPFVTDSDGIGTISLPIPPDPALAGVHFFDQSLIFDPRANPLGIVPISSTELEIGTGEQPEVDTVFAFNDEPPQPTGTKFLVPRAPIVRFTYLR